MLLEAAAYRFYMLVDRLFVLLLYCPFIMCVVLLICSYVYMGLFVSCLELS